MLFEDTCHQTVSILEALLLGAGDACIDIGIGSLLGGIVLFVVCVVTLRHVGSTLLRFILPKRRNHSERALMPDARDKADALERLPYEPPIRSTGAWGANSR